MISFETAQRRSETLKALGHPVRLRIVSLLNEDEMCVGDIAQHLEVGSAIVSQQLKILRLSGLVKSDRRNGHSYYSLAIDELSTLLTCLQNCDHH